MYTFYSGKAISLPLLLLLFITSCNAQNKPLPTQVIHEQSQIIVPADSNAHGMFRCSMKDKQGDLWFGTTLFGKLYKYDGTSFVSFTKEDGLSCSSIYSIAEDSAGNIWVGTNKGLFRGSQGKFTLVPIPGIKEGNSPSMSTIAGTGNSYGSVPDRSAVYSIVSDRNGNIWFGTENYGLWKYDGRSFTNVVYINNAWKIVPADSVQYYAEPRGGFIQYILADKNGSIWFSTAGSLTPRLNCYAGGMVKEVKVGDLSALHIFYMLQDRAGDLWLATRDNGVFRYNGRSFTNFNEKDGLLDNTSCLLEDKNGTIWIGSVGKMNDNGGRITRYDGKSLIPFPTGSLSNSGIWTMIEDKSGSIWIGTKEMGLYRYDGKALISFAGHAAK